MLRDFRSIVASTDAYMGYVGFQFAFGSPLGPVVARLDGGHGTLVGPGPSLPGLSDPGYRSAPGGPIRAGLGRWWFWGR